MSTPLTALALPLTPFFTHRFADGLCQWFTGDGVTPSLDEQVNITDCVSCHQQCKDGSTCVYWSFNGSAPTSIGNGCYGEISSSLKAREDECVTDGGQ